jgi:hypothetical protein
MNNPFLSRFADRRTRWDDYARLVEEARAALMWNEIQEIIADAKRAHANDEISSRQLRVTIMQFTRIIKGLKRKGLL